MNSITKKIATLTLAATLFTAPLAQADWKSNLSRVVLGAGVIGLVTLPWHVNTALEKGEISKLPVNHPVNNQKISQPTIHLKLLAHSYATICALALGGIGTWLTK